MTNTYSHAAREFDILSKTWGKDLNPDDKPVILEFRDEILALCEAFGKSGQSGGSAPMVATCISQAVKTLLLQEPICDLTGIDEEWMDVSEMSDEKLGTLYQNNREGGVFKDNNGYCYIDAIIWKGDTEGESGNNWDTFSGTVEGIKSRQFIDGFPFKPKTFYIDVTRVPYDPNVHSERESIECGDGVYVYLIKNKKQLERVWKYYRKPQDI